MSDEKIQKQLELLQQQQSHARNQLDKSTFITQTLLKQSEEAEETLSALEKEKEELKKTVSDIKGRLEVALDERKRTEKQMERLKHENTELEEWIKKILKS